MLWGMYYSDEISRLSNDEKHEPTLKMLLRGCGSLITTHSHLYHPDSDREKLGSKDVIPWGHQIQLFKINPGKYLCMVVTINLTSHKGASCLGMQSLVKEHRVIDQWLRVQACFAASQYAWRQWILKKNQSTKIN